MRYTVYGLKIKETDEYRYIGITSKGSIRFKQHISSALNPYNPGYRHPKSYWIRKHIDNIEFTVLANCNTLKEANEFEVLLIRIYKRYGHRLLNLTVGGDGVSCTKTKVHRNKISISRVNYWNRVHQEHIDEKICKLSCSRCTQSRHEYLKRKKKPKEYFCYCGNKMHSTSNKCISCSQKDREKIEWPTENELVLMLKESNYTIVSKKLGVSDNSVRKHIKTLGYDPKTLLKTDLDGILSKQGSLE